MKVLIAGGQGQIGTDLVMRLRSEMDPSQVIATDVKEMKGELRESELAPIHRRIRIFIAAEEAGNIIEHAVIQRRLDVKNLAILVDQFPKADNLMVQFRRRGIHVRV